ncbi:MAG: hypothetical protein J6W96_04850, partial [Alphaproteobacteria bacterium]|nr:hypothetical protein [Alphaproteobacteria bacterium]
KTMNGLVNMLINNLLSNRLNTMPQMQIFNQMMSGKNPQEQFQTIMNMAKSTKFDTNAIIITEQQAKELGLNIPHRSE